ncbi:MAG: hypothetical protein NT105_18255 [Verrucomicrobia bacterium]|nr:hypothetical protein [Verrucomicrobiota bacterium]
MRPETKPYDNIASDVFTLAHNKFQNFAELGGKIGATGHHVSDVAQGKTQPTAPLLFACLALTAPWLVDEIQHFIRKEVKKILEQQAAAEAVREKTSGANMGCLPGSPEGANA